MIETNLKDLNQLMHDDLNISVGARVKLITGMIMAGLGVPKKCSPLDVTDLQSNASADENDGQRIMTKIKAFLREKSLPDDKRDMILADLQGTFLNRGLWEPVNGESRLKQVYSFVKEKIIPYINPERSTYRDKISLEGNDWTVNQHKKWDTRPTIDDFKKTVADYLSWKVGQIIKNGAVNG